jgi:hypothetical protein
MGSGRATLDIHQHLLPPSFIEALCRRTAPPRISGSELELAEGRFPFDVAEHDPETRIALLDRLGTDVAVLSLQHTFGQDGLPPAGARSPPRLGGGITELVAGAGGRFAAL